MKTLNLSFLAIVICVVIACQWYTIVTIDADLFERTLKQTPNPQLVDVRTHSEYAEGHLIEAILIDVKLPSFDSLICRLDKNRPVFVYCRVGRRSLEAANILKKNDFKTIYNLDGGIVAWKEKGKAVKTGNE